MQQRPYVTHKAFKYLLSVPLQKTFYSHALALPLTLGNH